MKKFVKLVLLLMIVYPVVGLAVSSCAGESDCSIAGRPMLNATVHRMYGDSIANDTVDLLTVSAIGTDSILLNSVTEAHYFSLPLRYTDETTMWVFQHSDRQREWDTITLRHSNTPQFISMDCGYEMQQAVININYTNHRIDSISIISNSTNTNGTRNLRIFYR